MANSMTGYGRCQESLNGRVITVEIKAVNHRYFEFSCRVPRAYGFLEERLKKLVQASVSRGKVDVYVSITQSEGPDVSVSLNEPMLRSYLAALRRMSEEYDVTDDISVSLLARNTDLFQVLRQDEDAEEIWRDVSGTAGRALDAFLAMRAEEGANLTQDLLARVDSIVATLPQIEEASKRTCEIYHENLTAMLKELLGSVPLDEGRVITEVALYADRINVTEEVVRLRSHAAALAELLRSNAPSGRKMDFLLQEMNREINTIGSKSQIREIAMLVVENKAELEKIREQVQNLE
ncbi:MAG: YicC family protein [Clostridia bacterium]|nr:YicC family protein [Clostridia bacterium]